MAETKPIPVRLGEDVIQRLDVAAGRIGSNRASVIRMLINKWLEDFERGGKASLPPDWEQIMNQLDGRSTDARNVAEMPQAPSSMVAESHEVSKAAELPQVKTRYPAGKPPRRKQ